MSRAALARLSLQRRATSHWIRVASGGAAVTLQARGAIKGLSHFASIVRPSCVL